MKDARSSPETAVDIIQGILEPGIIGETPGAARIVAQEIAGDLERAGLLSHAQPQQSCPETETLIENLIQASYEYERCEPFEAKYKRKELEDAKQELRAAIGHAQTQQVTTSLQDAVRGLNEAIDDYWNTRRTDEGVKLICYWQFKCREALSDTSTEGK